MHYKIAEAFSLEELEKIVNELLNEGYMPVGGIVYKTIRTRKKTREAPTGEWDNKTQYIQPLLRAIPEIQAAKLKDFNSWDRFATNCNYRRDMDCEYGDKKGGCIPQECPREDKPKINPVSFERDLKMMENIRRQRG